MGIVADSVLDRVRHVLDREYHWSEWESCADALGLRCTEIEGLLAPAYLVANWIVLRKGLTERERAWYGWEEIGHHLTVAGNREHWRSCLPGLQGELNWARCERWAATVRLELPRWE